MVVSQINFSSIRRTNNNNVLPFKGQSETQKNYGVLAKRVDNFGDTFGIAFQNEEPLQKAIKSLTVDQAKNTITERLKKLQNKLWYLIYHDPMLDIPNRRAFERDRVKVFVKSMKKEKPLGYVSLDLDNFGGYNNEYGHNNGDKALKVFSDSVKKALSCRGVLYRCGGEEFVALVYNKAEPEEMKKLAEKLRRTVERVADKEKKAGNLPQNFTVSIGYSLIEPSEDTKDVNALYEAKMKGDLEAAEKFREKFEKYFVEMEKSVDDALYISKLVKGRNSSTCSKEINDNDKYQIVLDLGRELAGVMRNSSQKTSEVLVDKLVKHREKL